MEKLIFIVVMVIALYLSINVVQNFSIKFDLLNQVLDEFNLGYIEDISIANKTSSKCPENYEEISEDFSWPGNYKGCGCQNKENNFIFNYGSCPSIKNCFPVEETFKVNMNKWRKEIICIKRSKNSYLTYNLTENNNNTLPCSNTTHKNCGIIDGNLNHLCLERSQECPINDIQIIKNDKNLNLTPQENSTKFTIISEDSNLFNYSAIKLSKDFLLVFSKKEIDSIESKKIPINFRVEIGEKPCLSYFKHPENSLFFPLMKNKFNFMCDLFPNKTEILDENINSIDTYKLEDFFEENNYLIQIKDLISPFGIDNSEKNINLFGRNYLGWKYNCLISSSLSLRNFILIEENLNKILIITILHSFISIGGIIVLGIFACFLSKYFEILFKLMNLVFCLFNLIFPIQIISNSNWIINLFTDEDGYFCGDNTLNILLKEISDSCLQLQNSYIWILLITIIYTFFFIFMMYSWIKPFHQEYQDKFKNYISLK